jgi:hypothetical protein
MCCAIVQLRDQEERLAELVDGMVQGYHSGFARSIQNYSQILHLFGEAKDQVGFAAALLATPALGKSAMHADIK